MLRNDTRCCLAGYREMYTLNCGSIADAMDSLGAALRIRFMTRELALTSTSARQGQKDDRHQIPIVAFREEL